jgi:predicted RNA-binding protein YlxR (DUF448 family)
MREKNHSRARAGAAPERTCIGCMKRDAKSAMARIALVNRRVSVDLQAQHQGRGGYLHRSSSCIERFVNSKVKEFKALKSRIDRAARLDIAAALKLRLDREAKVE